MQATSIIGQSITITGDITADEPLTIAGRVDGTVSLTGHSLTIDDAGHVNADVLADAVIISGHVTVPLAAPPGFVVGKGASTDGFLPPPFRGEGEGPQF